MNNIARYLLLFLVVVLTYQNKANAFQNDTTTFVLVRHAEKADDGTRNPPLTQEGLTRSQNLINVLSDFDISSIYSTPYKRTEQTAGPISEKLGIPVQSYTPSRDMNWLFELAASQKGKTILIVGHSNTTPALGNALLGEELIAPIKEETYGNVFIISVPATGKSVLRTSRF